ncbi:ThiF family adenylyltransferase [Endozoicomonas sp.]|uniref:ThiF family adenylyltransferase n=1 Tax=Endozoicomonas sp. TaxID=1892382 RepID=UPI003AF867BB
MDYDAIYEHFLDGEYDVQPLEYSGQTVLSVNFECGDEIATLIHFTVSELEALPSFYLLNHKRYGQLAHVLAGFDDPDIGSVCVNDRDSVSVNFERPELAFEESIKRHISLLRSVIENPEHNEQELLREFRSNWHHAASKLWESFFKMVYVAPASKEFEVLELYSPVQPGKFFSIPTSHVALSSQAAGEDLAEYFRKRDRHRCNYAQSLVIPLESVDVNLPRTTPELREWVIRNLERVSQQTRERIEQSVLGLRAKEFWLMLNCPTPSGVTWFGIRLFQGDKKSFPDTNEKISRWKVEPLVVEAFHRERLMPRSGANCELSDKRVLLVGCGSVGSELADKLGAAGVGYLDICDPDNLSVANIYRHTLDQNFIEYPKASSVAFQLRQKYPWYKVRGYSDRLLDFRKQDLASRYDLVIVAIGSPTHERLFHQHLQEHKINIPVVYTWLEGYGIGGHVVLDIAGKKGCLRCAYVDNDSGRRGLASNLNFLQTDQNIVKNYAGCGEMFIPYGAVSSAQTALTAADLAIRYLNGKLEQSSKVSWKGDRKYVDEEGFLLTRRYDRFNASLKVLPLYHPACDICGSHNKVVFAYQDIQLSIPEHVLERLSEFRQISPEHPEAAGLLIGYADVKGNTTIDRITLPKPTDTRKRAYFSLDAERHQEEVDQAFEDSDGVLGYFGTWHTHPQAVPAPSNLDLMDWQKHYDENTNRQLFFIVAGTEKMSVYTMVSGKSVEMKMDEY